MSKKCGKICNLLLTRRENLIYCNSTISHLIKSGGGNGPVKPGNLRLQGAKSGGDTKDEAYIKHCVARRRYDGAFFVFVNF